MRSYLIDSSVYVEGACPLDPASYNPPHLSPCSHFAACKTRSQSGSYALHGSKKMLDELDSIAGSAWRTAAEFIYVVEQAASVIILRLCSFFAELVRNSTHPSIIFNIFVPSIA
jgi:hypothetical protein